MPLKITNVRVLLGGYKNIRISLTNTKNVRKTHRYRNFCWFFLCDDEDDMTIVYTFFFLMIDVLTCEETIISCEYITNPKNWKRDRFRIIKNFNSSVAEHPFKSFIHKQRTTCKSNRHVSNKFSHNHFSSQC